MKWSCRHGCPPKDSKYSLRFEQEPPPAVPDGVELVLPALAPAVVDDPYRTRATGLGLDPKLHHLPVLLLARARHHPHALTRLPHLDDTTAIQAGPEVEHDGSALAAHHLAGHEPCLEAIAGRHRLPRLLAACCHLDCLVDHAVAGGSRVLGGHLVSSGFSPAPPRPGRDSSGSIAGWAASTSR